MTLRILIGCLALATTASLAAAHDTKQQSVSKSRADQCVVLEQGGYSSHSPRNKASELPYRRQGSNPDFPMLYKGI